MKSQRRSPSSKLRHKPFIANWIKCLFARKELRHRRALQVEPLEMRSLLAVIVWGNRGTGATDTDGFVTAFGSGAAADSARAVIDRD